MACQMLYQDMGVTSPERESYLFLQLYPAIPLSPYSMETYCSVAPKISSRSLSVYIDRLLHFMQNHSS